jgi:hypothetical protein
MRTTSDEFNLTSKILVDSKNPLGEASRASSETAEQVVSHTGTYVPAARFQSSI